MNESKIKIDVVFALSGRRELRRILLPEGSTVEDAIRVSGLSEGFPEFDPSRVGVHGKLVPGDTILRDRDRVEIYRPLRADPKEVRRTRAAKKRAKE